MPNRKERPDDRRIAAYLAEPRLVEGRLLYWPTFLRGIFMLALIIIPVVTAVGIFGGHPGPIAIRVNGHIVWEEPWVVLVVFGSIPALMVVVSVRALVVLAWGRYAVTSTAIVQSYLGRRIIWPLDVAMPLQIERRGMWWTVRPSDDRKSLLEVDRANALAIARACRAAGIVVNDLEPQERSYDLYEPVLWQSRFKPFAFSKSDQYLVILSSSFLFGYNFLVVKLSIYMVSMFSSNIYAKIFAGIVLFLTFGVGCVVITFQVAKTFMQRLAVQLFGTLAVTRDAVLWRYPGAFGVQRRILRDDVLEAAVVDDEDGGSWVNLAVTNQKSGDVNDVVITGLRDATGLVRALAQP
jgi:hypothetical protein